MEMLVSLPKRCSVKESILKDDYTLWDERRIRLTFNFRQGTMKDLEKFCKDNGERIIGFEDFKKVLDEIPENRSHLEFINAFICRIW